MKSKKSKKGTLSPLMERVLIDALRLWQVECKDELRKIAPIGEQPMFHENYTSSILRKFGVAFGIDELIDHEYMSDEDKYEAALDDVDEIIYYHNHHRMNH